MQNSIVRFAEERTSRGHPLHWHRASEDGLPYRGTIREAATPAEFEARAVRVSDFQSGLFATDDPAQKSEYDSIMDKHHNGWFRVQVRKHMFQKRKGMPPAVYIYLEWLELFLEDGSPAQMPEQNFNVPMM